MKLNLKFLKISDRHPGDRKENSFKAIIEDNTYIAWVDEYLSEKELSAGKFTYEVTVNDVVDTTSLVINL